ncbi:MAG: hypothetical protein HY076_00160 [Candidatus Eisenbacteria bacterium]|uniref:FlgD/Vpr Ig-like domain-containing protein n=1 Tax=Eiseniibacteriota bacterium TaxID=2212470 RepID=A0A9D6L845_UNCEI|nr:hypothetical protein [Candidatus Eisenbacteria bacterium]
MFRSSATFVALALPALLLFRAASADPGVDVFYRDGNLRVTLRGNYAGSYYQVWRADDSAGVYAPVLAQSTLCTGDCFVQELDARPGRTVYYRFDLVPPAGGLISYGPYAIAVPDTPLGVRASPNPSSRDVRVELSLPGSNRYDGPVDADVRVIDLEGRTVRVLLAGPVGRGVTPVLWDGTNGSGRPVGAGIYFVRLRTPIGRSFSRIVRFR